MFQFLICNMGVMIFILQNFCEVRMNLSFVYCQRLCWQESYDFLEVHDAETEIRLPVFNLKVQVSSPVNQG